MSATASEHSESARWRHTDFILLTIVLLIGVATRAMTFDRPFERDPEGCGAFYGTLARNYLRHDILKNFAVPIQSIGLSESPPSLPPVFYPNHPPLVPLFVAGVYRVCGWNPKGSEIPRDWQTRLPTTCFTLACIATIFIIIRNRAGLRAGILAACIFALLPMTLIFGSQPDVINTQLVFFALLTVCAYEHFYRAPSSRSLLILCLAFALAALTDWPAFYLAPVLAIHFVSTRPPRAWGWMIAFGVFTGAMFLLLYVQIVAVTHDWRWMGRLVARRMSSALADDKDVITFAKWMTVALGRNGIGRHTWPVVILMLAWLALLFSNVSFRRQRSTRFIGLMLAWGALHVLVGRQGVYVHEWWWWPLSAGAAMSAGAALDFLLRAIKLPSRAQNAIAVALLAIFGMIRIRAATVELADFTGVVRNSPLDYSIREIGDAIRSAAPFNHAVMLAESDASLGLWLYADRPIKLNIWTPESFEERLHDDHCDIQFNLSEPWPEKPVAMIVPKVYLAAPIRTLVEYLDAHYPKRESGKFVVYEIDKATRGQGDQTTRRQGERVK